MLMRTPNRTPAQGFTIIELLIAVSVFALVLILITTGVLNFSRQYYKGVISGNTQDTARAILDDVTRSIQFTGGDYAPITANGLPISPRNPIAGYCVGQTKRYSFYPNSQVTDTAPNASQHQALHALISDTGVTACNANTRALNAKNAPSLAGHTNARELLAPHMRLAKFTISGGNNLYDVSVKVVYGDDQLLCSTSVPAWSDASCNNHNPRPGLPNNLSPNDIANLTCRSNSVSQFCAVSELTTTVDKRVKRVN